MNTVTRRPGYSVFVRFRKTRLALRRGIVRVEDALALAEELRKNRFHDPDDVFVVKEPEGTIVTEDGRPAPLAGPARAGAEHEAPPEEKAPASRPARPRRT